MLLPYICTEYNEKLQKMPKVSLVLLYNSFLCGYTRELSTWQFDCIYVFHVLFSKCWCGISF